jgi:hypothetical protein
LSTEEKSVGIGECHVSEPARRWDGTKKHGANAERFRAGDFEPGSVCAMAAFANEHFFWNKFCEQGIAYAGPNGLGEDVAEDREPVRRTWRVESLKQSVDSSVATPHAESGHNTWIAVNPW